MRRCLGIALIGAGVAGACQKTTVDEPVTQKGAAPQEPSPCAVRVESEPLCDFSSGSNGLGGALEFGGAPGLGGVHSESTDACWIKSQAQIECSTLAGVVDVARGIEGSLDVLVGIAGVAGETDDGYDPNSEVYLYAHQDDEAPTKLGTYVSDGSVGEDVTLVGSSGEVGSVLVWQSGNEAGGSTLSVRSFPDGDEVATMELSGPPTSQVATSIDTSPSWVALLQPPGAPTIIEDLMNPQLVPFFHNPWSVAFAPDETGAAMIVSHEGGAYRVFSGEAFTDEIGGWPGSTTTPAKYFDFRTLPNSDGSWVGVLLVGSSSPSVVRVDDAVSTSVVPLAGGSTTCDFWTVGITCDDCQDGTPCETRAEAIERAALLSSGGRVFAAHLSEVEVTRKRITRHTNLTGLVCTCNPDTVSSAIESRHLVVTEIISQEGSLTLERRMDVNIPLDWPSGYVSFSRDRQGNLDLVLGPSLFSFSGPLQSFPETPQVYRVIQIAPPSAQSPD